MTNTIIFEAPQANLTNGEGGVQLSSVVLPYSIRNSADGSQYLGGQMTLNADDGVKFSDNTHDWKVLALAKIKEMVAAAEIYVPDPIIEVPEELPDNSEAEAPVSSAEASEDTVASSATDSPASSEATVEASEAPVTNE